MAQDPKVRQVRFFVADGDILPTVDFENPVRFFLPVPQVPSDWEEWVAGESGL